MKRCVPRLEEKPNFSKKQAPHLLFKPISSKQIQGKIAHADEHLNPISEFLEQPPGIDVKQLFRNRIDGASKQVQSHPCTETNKLDQISNLAALPHYLQDIDER